MSKNGTQLKERAAELRRKGRIYAEIAAELGVSLTTAYRWVNPERIQPYRNGRAIDAERARAVDRDYARAHRGRCTSCDGLMGIGVRQDGVCAACLRRPRETRAHRIEAWWAEGLSLREIAAKLGWTPNRLGVEMHGLREEGYDLPYRYTTGKRAGGRVAA